MGSELATKLNSETNQGWHGNLALTLAHHHGNTRPIYSQAQAPLKLQKPFYPEGPEVCHSVILHTAGGIVGGDRLSLQVDLHPQAKSLITTAAASKIYRSNGLTAQQQIQVQVAEGACLEWLPQEAIVFNGALYQQTLRVELAPQAMWMGWEITRLGRSARGEQFLQGEWRSRTEVWRQGQPLWIDRQWLQGGEEMTRSPHGLAGQPVVGSFAFVGRCVEPELVEQARSLWANLMETQSGSQAGEVGVTRLIEGLVCRYRGPSSETARRWFIDVWRLLRQSYQERSLCVPRVWQLSPHDLSP